MDTGLFLKYLRDHTLEEGRAYIPSYFDLPRPPVNAPRMISRITAPRNEIKTVPKK